jgi:transposase
MPRTHGYCAKGTRCYGVRDWGAKGRTNVIGAIISGLMLTANVFATNVNSDVFHGWVTQCLIPKCPPNAVIVMDNATFHKRKDTQDAIHKAGYTLEYLPTYSPDLNPIEPKWAQAKAIRRKYQCSIEDIFTYKLNQFICE